MLFIDVRKAHLDPKCEEDVYIELPEECGAGPGVCGKLKFWLYGFRKAASAWENLYAEYLESVGFERGTSCGVVFYHSKKDISLAVHGDDFTFCGLEEDLFWIRDLMKSWFEVKVRALLGPDPKDSKEVVILGRVVRYQDWGYEYGADPKHRLLVMEFFNLQEDSRTVVSNGNKDDREDDEDEVEADRDEAKLFRGVVARLNFLSLDCPVLHSSTIPLSDLPSVCYPPLRGTVNQDSPN